MKKSTDKILSLGAIAVVGVALSISFVTSQALAQLGSLPFQNPPEIRSNPTEKRLREVIELVNGEFLIPGVGKEQLRQFRGRNAEPKVPNGAISPGPTLRARLGDQIQVALLNKADRNMFPFSYVTGRDNPPPPPFSSLGCDKAGLPDSKGKFPYPASDIYPNCFHGSTTANLHYHGTHTSPDGLGDNVLVQVLADDKQQDWIPTFNKIFDNGKIPPSWADLPKELRDAQLDLVRKRDIEQAAENRKNDLPEPESMLKANLDRIGAGLWPQYFIGAFPNIFDLPDYSSGKVNAGQAPGTHWYHAHKHGSTSLHIRNGLAGALIIESSQEGGYDHFIRKSFGWGDRYDQHEKILIFQQYDPTQNLERPGQARGKGSRQVLVNGLLTPTITMRPGEVQLWRLINATQGNTAGIINAGNFKTGVFQTAGFTFVQTAQDGVQFSPLNYVNQPFLNGRLPNGVIPPADVPNGLILAAANRADLLVKAPATPIAQPVPFKSGNTTLFWVKVEGDAVSPDRPFPVTWMEMPKFLQDLPKPGLYDIKNPGSPVKFQWEDGRTGTGRDPDPPHFMINNRQFGELGPLVDQCMPQDGLQDWVLENYTTEIAHPFHIHINPFQIIEMYSPMIEKTYTPTDNFVWQDVIAIPPAKIDGTKIIPGRVIIRQKYPDFTGTFVLHCHILAHEDRGMMQLVRIVPRANYPKACQDHPPAHH
jgi:FtsP/CotA-like multicopper oxidase with cupredoxin domain